MPKVVFSRALKQAGGDTTVIQGVVPEQVGIGVVSNGVVLLRYSSRGTQESRTW